MGEIFLHLEELKKKQKAIIFATEPDEIYQIKKHSPGKKNPLAANNGWACNEYPHMRLNTLEKMAPDISIPDDIRIWVLKPLERMLTLS